MTLAGVGHNGGPPIDIVYATPPPGVAVLTPKQVECTKHQLAGRYMHYCTYGGARSTKTFRNVRQVVARAVFGAHGRHAIVRSAQKHVKSSVVADTFPKVMRLCFPHFKLGHDYKINKTDLVATFTHNGAEIWFLGLDDAERAEKILGMEFATIFLNEVSQIAYKSVVMALSRLAQKVPLPNGTDMPLLALYDCNPPKTKKHWSYQVFIEKIDPETGKPLNNSEDYGAFQMNPADNPHLPEATKRLYQNMNPADRKRYWLGEFGEDAGGMWNWGMFKPFPARDALPDFRRVVVAVDPPAGTGNAASEDETNVRLAEAGIIVVGLGTDGHGYVLRDVSVKGAPEKWARAAVNAYHAFQADAIVGEVNQGGDMVRAVIHAVDATVNFRAVRATRGKAKRAEPVAALYGEGRIKHNVGLDTLETQMCEFTTDFDVQTAGYSPDRVDALVWGLTDLMLVKTSGHGAFDVS